MNLPKYIQPGKTVILCSKLFGQAQEVKITGINTNHTSPFIEFDFLTPPLSPYGNPLDNCRVTHSFEDIADYNATWTAYEVIK